MCLRLARSVLISMRWVLSLLRVQNVGCERVNWLMHVSHCQCARIILHTLSMTNTHTHSQDAQNKTSKNMHAHTCKQNSVLCQRSPQHHTPTPTLHNCVTA